MRRNSPRITINDIKNRFIDQFISQANILISAGLQTRDNCEWLKKLGLMLIPITWDAAQKPLLIELDRLNVERINITVELNEKIKKLEGELERATVLCDQCKECKQEIDEEYERREAEYQSDCA